MLRELGKPQLLQTSTAFMTQQPLFSLSTIKFNINQGHLIVLFQWLLASEYISKEHLHRAMAQKVFYPLEILNLIGFLSNKTEKLAN